MRLLTKEEFLKLSKPTLFFYYEGNLAFDDLHIKYDTLWDEDFVCMSLLNEIKYTGEQDADIRTEKIEMQKKFERGESIELDYEAASRDWLYEENQKYAVLEKKDVQKMIAILQTIN